MKQKKDELDKRFDEEFGTRDFVHERPSELKSFIRSYSRQKVREELERVMNKLTLEFINLMDESDRKHYVAKLAQIKQEEK